MPSKPARMAEVASPLHPLLAERLPDGGLWTHQAAAVDLALAGHSVAVATGTASGKSLCYQLPIAQAVLENRRSTALLLFPTKALAQDQLRGMTGLEIPNLTAVTYDGDTPQERRAWIRRHAHAGLTKPHQLHIRILPHHRPRSAVFAHPRHAVLAQLH